MAINTYLSTIDSKQQNKQIGRSETENKISEINEKNN